MMDETSRRLEVEDSQGITFGIKGGDLNFRAEGDRCTGDSEEKKGEKGKTGMWGKKTSIFTGS